MLLQFSVSNFKSIKDEVFFTAFANNRNEHKDNLIIACFRHGDTFLKDFFE